MNNATMTVNGTATHFETTDALVAAYVAQSFRPTDKVRVTVGGKVARVEVYKGKASLTVF